MNETPAFHGRLQRRALGRLAALLTLVVSAEMVLGLFANWSLERLHAQYHQQTTIVLRAVNEAREAQVEFKIQVQSWKNLLLRGSEPGERQALLDELVVHEARVQKHLAALVGNLSELHGLPGSERIDDDLIDRARLLAPAHQRIGEDYRLELQRHESGPWNPFRLDASVKGLDRPLDQNIDQLTEALLRYSDRVVSLARSEAQQRFRLLGHLLWWAAGVALVLIGVLIYSALRHQDPPT